MTVTSLLSVPKSIAGTTAAAVKNNWKLIASAIILRVEKHVDAIYPGQIFLAIIAFVVALMTSIFTHAAPTWIGVISKTMWVGSWLTLLSWVILYGLYEFVQGCKWLSRWAKRVEYEKEERIRKS